MSSNISRSVDEDSKEGDNDGHEHGDHHQNNLNDTSLNLNGDESSEPSNFGEFRPTDNTR